MRLIALVAACLSVPLTSQAATWTAVDTAWLDGVVSQALAKSAAPSASVAVIQAGKVVLTKAYGLRSVAPPEQAVTSARYRIGSVSKSFTAAAVLMLQGQGRLSLDDKVGRWLPELTDAQDVSLRQVLSHTAGYRGYFTIDYLVPEGKRPIDRRQIADRWGREPLDFPPGTRWRYSNTDYTIAGLVVEKVTGASLDSFVRQHVFQPLGMTSAATVAGRPLGAGDAVGYSRYVLALPHRANIVGAGWEFAAGQWSMTASDLAKWDLSVLNRSLMASKLYDEMEHDVVLSDGKPSGYGLGVYVDEVGVHRRVAHNGSTEGFGTENRLYPGDRDAVVVMVNADYGDAPSVIADAVEERLLSLPQGPPTADYEHKCRAEPIGGAPAEGEKQVAARLVGGLRRGEVDRTLLTTDASAYFTHQVLSEYQASLAPLGKPAQISQIQADVIDGLHASIYELCWPGRKLVAIQRLTPAGKIEAFTIFSP